MLAASRKPSLATLGTALAAVLASSPGSGAIEWTSKPAVTVDMGGDSNIYLSPVDEHHASWGALTASADVLARDPGFEFRVRPEIRALRYSNNRAVDRNDAFTTFNVGLNNERRSWSFGGNYARESTLTSEFESSGILGVDQERVQRSVDTGWSRIMNSRGRLSLNAVVTDNAYGDSFGSPLADYRYRTLQAGYTLSTAPRSAWQFAAVRSVLDSARFGQNTTNTQLSVTWSHAFSETLRGGFGVTVFDAGSDGPAPDQGATPALNFSITREWPRWTLNSSGGSSVRPEGLGTLVREDATTLEAQRRFGDRLSITASVRSTRVAATGFFAALHDRDYAQAGVTVNWRLSERWVLNGALFKRAQEWTFVPRAEGLTSGLGLSYRGR